MAEDINNNFPFFVAKENQGAVESLGEEWAKKYLQNLEVDDVDEETYPFSLTKVVSSSGREKTAQFMASLRSLSVKAWNKTEALLASQVKRHDISLHLMDLWQNAADYFTFNEKALRLYNKQPILPYLSGKALDEKALQIYTQQVTPSQLATVIGKDVDILRQKYTKQDPRVIGFFVLHHNTSLLGKQTLSLLEQTIVYAYFKVIDDHLYMPLQRVYKAAAEHDYDSTALTAVQKFLAVSTQSGKKIAQKVIEVYPIYRSLSGCLSDQRVKTSSIRDMEMFQVYLWLCTLEGSTAAIQQKLFPLCVMLYRTLKVHWELIKASALAGVGKSQYLNAIFSSFMAYVQRPSVW